MTTAQVMDVKEGIVMRDGPRYVPARPERAGRHPVGRRAGQASARHGAGSRHGTEHAGRDAKSAADAEERAAVPGSAGRGPAGPDRVERLIAPVTAALGMDLESVRVTAAGRRRLLRVVVDKDGGVSLDEVAHLSRELSAALDASGVMGEMPYTLEVSSPGVGRPLTQPRHWRRAAGRLARVHVASSGTIQGRVVAADEAAVILDVGGEHRTFGYPDLGPGEVLVEFGNVGEGPVAQEPGTRGPGAEPDGH